MDASLFDTTVDIERLTAVPGTGKKNYAAHLSDIPAHIQPYSPEITASGAGAFGKEFLLFCNSVDITETDRVIYSGENYNIVSVEYLSFNGQSHMEIILRKEA